MLNLLGAEIGNTWFLPFENSFILWLQSLGGKNSFIYYLMNFITMFGEEMILVGIMGLIYWGLDKKRGERIGFGLLATTLFNPLIKNIVCRTRPFDSQSGIQNLRDVDGYSFPSGHSSGSASLFVGTAVTYRDKKKKWLIAGAVVIPLLVALSRNYLGAHYLTDVAAGLALGVGVVFLYDFLFRVVKCKYIIYGATLLVGTAGMFYCTTSDYFTGYGIMLGFICGILFEERVTKFENTRLWWRIALRVAVGGGLFLGLNELIKLPFSGLIYEKIINDAGETVKVIKDNMVLFERGFRTVRYALVTFLVIGIYPMLFRLCDKLWIKLKFIKPAAQIDTEAAEQEITEPTEVSKENGEPAEAADCQETPDK